MKRIKKTTEPSTLTHYRSSIPQDSMSDSNIYEDFKNKSQTDCSNGVSGNLRKQLLEEQGYICCYCMSRIDCKSSKIEHFKPQTKYRHLQIDYNNLFVSCSGGESNRGKDQYCDTKKGEGELKKVNLLSNIEDKIEYKKEGSGIKIYSADNDLHQDIENILNLNVGVLSKNRKEVYNNIISNLNKKRFKVSDIKRAIEYFKTKHNGKYEPFCEMLVWFLVKKLKSKGVSL